MKNPPTVVWGNSLAVRLPAAIVEALDLKPGDNIDIPINGDRTFAIEGLPQRPDRLSWGQGPKCKALAA